MLKNNILSTNMKTLVNIQKSIQTNIEIASSNSVAINEQTSISIDQSGTVFEINLGDDTGFFNIYLPGNSDMSSDKSLYYKFIIGTTFGNSRALIRLDSDNIQIFGNIISPGSEPQDGTISFNHSESIEYLIITENAKPGDYIELFCLTPEKWFFRGFSSYNYGIQYES